MTRHHIIVNAAEDIAADGRCFDAPEVIRRVEFNTGLRLKVHERVIALSVYRRRLLDLS